MYLENVIARNHTSFEEDVFFQSCINSRHLQRVIAVCLLSPFMCCCSHCVVNCYIVLGSYPDPLDSVFWGPGYPRLVLCCNSCWVWLCITYLLQSTVWHGSWLISTHTYYTGFQVCCPDQMVQSLTYTYTLSGSTHSNKYKARAHQSLLHSSDNGLEDWCNWNLCTISVTLLGQTWANSIYEHLYHLKTYMLANLCPQRMYCIAGKFGGH